MRGSTHTITWTSVSVTGDVTLKLYEGGVDLGRISPDPVPYNGSFSWTIGAALPNGTAIPACTDYQVMVRSSREVSDLSNRNFTISIPSTPASIRVTSPNGGETWARGSSPNITWRSSGVSGNVTLKLIKGRTDLGRIDADPVADSGIYRWTIPRTLPNGTAINAGSDYKVMVRYDASINDQSDDNFTISTRSFEPPRTMEVATAIMENLPSLRITYPTGARPLVLNGPIRIRWTSRNVPDSNLINIDLYRGRVYLGHIVEGLAPGRISHDWSVGSLTSGRSVSPGSNYKIKVFLRPGRVQTFSVPLEIEEERHIDMRCWVESHEIIDGGRKVRLKVHIASNRFRETLRNIPLLCSIKVSGMTSWIETKTETIGTYRYHGSRSSTVKFVDLGFGSYYTPRDRHRTWDYVVEVTVDPDDTLRDRRRSNNKATYRFTY